MNPRHAAIEEGFSQDWEIYQVVTSDIPGMATYMELATVCSVEDLYNMLEIIEVKSEYDDLARIKAEQESANR